MSKEEKDYAIVAIIDNRFIFDKSTQRDNEKEEIVDILRFDGPVAEVHRGYGLTLNIKNYESAKLYVSIKVPCYLSDVDAADEWARQWVKKRIVQEVENVRGVIEPKY